MPETMTPPTRPIPAVQPPTEADGYRSIADGELQSSWTLAEYFQSLNTVMRLPPKLRRRAEQAAKAVPGGTRVLNTLENFRLPKGMIAASLFLAIGVFVVRPLVLAASGPGAALAQLSDAFGVWQADGKGKYEGRMFELGEHSIAFRTSSRSPDYTWHKIDGVRATGRADSTLFVVTYVEDGKTADFSFWYMPRGGSPAIRFEHVPEVVWLKTPYEPVARPRI